MGASFMRTTCKRGESLVFGNVLITVVRTARGRVATSNAYLHFGLKPPAGSGTQELPFDDD